VQLYVVVGEAVLVCVQVLSLRLSPLLQVYPVTAAAYVPDAVCVHVLPLSESPELQL
jgi:hypothetical protein